MSVRSADTGRVYNGEEERGNLRGVRIHSAGKSSFVQFVRRLPADRWLTW